MRHVPNVFIAGAWPDGDLAPTPSQVHHLTTVLRIRRGDPVWYTDGAGRRGRGEWTGAGIARGAEAAVERGRRVHIYLAPPRARDRQRFAVEKLTELGVAEVGWLRTTHGQGKPPSASKEKAWAVAALEQSRGAWLPEMAGPVELSAVLGSTIAADLDGDWQDGGEDPVRLLVGPEGGWAPGELESTPRMPLASTVLRTETAAIVGAAILRREHHRG